MVKGIHIPTTLSPALFGNVFGSRPATEVLTLVMDDEVKKVRKFDRLKSAHMVPEKPVPSQTVHTPPETRTSAITCGRKRRQLRLTV